MRCGFLIWSWFICQIDGHFHGSFRNRPEMPQRVSPLTTVYSDGASAARSASVTLVSPSLAGADAPFSAVFPAAGGIPFAQRAPGTKLARATTKVIIGFRIGGTR